MTTKQLKNRGFTLVELLIVIVVIAILTVISLVAYNGIQNRARTTTAEATAKSLADKVQMYYSDKGSYPTDTQVTSDLTNSSNVNKSWHYDTNAISIGTPAQTAEPKTVSYKKCNDNGAKIGYFNYNEGSVKYRTIGDQTTSGGGAC